MLLKTVYLWNLVIISCRMEQRESCSRFAGPVGGFDRDVAMQYDVNTAVWPCRWHLPAYYSFCFVFQKNKHLIYISTLRNDHPKRILSENTEEKKGDRNLTTVVFQMTPSVILLACQRKAYWCCQVAKKSPLGQLQPSLQRNMHKIWDAYRNNFGRFR